MDKVKLVTAKGDFVCMGEIPWWFREYPEVVVWGSRVFQLQTVQKTGEITQYREVLAVDLVNIVHGEQ